MIVRHVFVSTKPDGSNASKVKPSHWNEDHLIIPDPVVNPYIDGEIPTGIINSTDGSDGNGTFTLAFVPSPTASIQLFKNGLLMLKDQDYFLVGITISYDIGRFPKTGDWHRVWYRK